MFCTDNNLVNMLLVSFSGLATCQGSVSELKMIYVYLISEFCSYPSLIREPLFLEDVMVRSRAANSSHSINIICKHDVRRRVRNLAS